MFEVVIFKATRMFLFSPPTPKDFIVDEVVKFKTKDEAMHRVKGENSWRACVDVAEPPIFVYSVVRKKRRLVYKQGWNTFWGDPVVYPQGKRAAV